MLLRTQYESYAIDNQTDSLLPERKDSLEYYTFLRFNRRKDTLFVYKKDTLKDIAQKDAFFAFNKNISKKQKKIAKMVLRGTKRQEKQIKKDLKRLNKRIEKMIQLEK